MARPLRYRLQVAALAFATVAFTAPAAWAFSTENINANQNGNSRFADPDDQVKNTQPFGQSGPTMRFGTSSGGLGVSPFSSHFGGNSGSPPPSPYAMPAGNGN